MKVSLLTNSPGELWGWARPVVAEMRRRGHSVSLWLLPCQFASGRERAAASGLGVDKLEGPDGSAHTWRALAEERADRVVQLGGDLIFGRRLAARARAPLFCYAYGFKKGMGHSRVFTAYPRMAEAIDKKLGKTRACVIGDLVKDSLALERQPFLWDEEKDSPRLLLFPGSRPAIRGLALNWLGEVVRSLRETAPEIRVRALFSPFVPDGEFIDWVDAGLNPCRAEPGTAMKSADYALTQPGTNTLEMMHSGLPALAAAPADFLRLAPVAGLGGLAAGVPAIGPWLKERAIRRNLERYGGFMTWPNRIAGRRVLDEISGDITPRDVARRVAEAVRDKERLNRVRGELLSLSGPEGAVLRLCDAVEREGRASDGGRGDESGN
jgi:lipid-A-disaccharide synthase